MYRHKTIQGVVVLLLMVLSSPITFSGEDAHAQSSPESWKTNNENTLIFFLPQKQTLTYSTIFFSV